MCSGGIRRTNVRRGRIESSGFHVAEPGSRAGDAQPAKGRPVVLAFFPAAFSSTCQKELCTFRDALSQLNKARAQVYGISVDTFFSLKAFADQQRLMFPLLSDFNKQVIRDYGVFNEDMIGLKGIAKRAVFVLDKDGVVLHREVLDDARNEPNYEKVYSILASLDGYERAGTASTRLKRDRVAATCVASQRSTCRCLRSPRLPLEPSCA